ncbi:hypothetical protein ACCO45_000395 [Purpureocillium lilacinum]|uniref:Uncharacterized protein n=1 Tax=Purpureocillium lilacinum TaxID=33203 RepID=A0ACC4E426_PURLI
MPPVIAALPEDTSSYVTASTSGFPTWTAESWRSKPVAQAVEYENAGALEETCSYLRQLPPLVSSSEIERARAEFYHVALGRGFIIQGATVPKAFTTFDTVSSIGKSTCFAAKAEFWKRRSENLSLHLAELQANTRSRGLIHSKHSHRGRLSTPFGDTTSTLKIRLIAGQTPIDFFWAISTLPHLKIPFATFWRLLALHLPYEASLTRDHYNLSATTIWLGERTRQRDGAHVEYARGLRNPVGVKIGPTATPAEVVALLSVLAPDQMQHGKITIITRMGHGKVVTVLAPIIRAVQLSGHVPIWMCDPCHGNTIVTQSGIKTRRARDMLLELQETYLAHRSLGSHLGGIHLEQTGDDVTECLDNDHLGDEDDLKSCYKSLCDPRLSRDQALTLVTDFAKFVEKQGTLA